MTLFQILLLKALKEIIIKLRAMTPSTKTKGDIVDQITDATKSLDKPEE